MTIPNYLATFRRAVREQGRGEKSELSEKSPTLISHNSLISHHPALPSAVARGTQADICNLHSARIAKVQVCEKSEISEQRADAFAFAQALDRLERRCPDFIEADRWQRCLLDAQHFIGEWGDKALALGWSDGELFGLHEPPAKPHPSYSRLSRYDATGLLWLLHGRRVIVLTANTAAIETAGGIVVYRKLNKPALGPLGDSLDDFSGDPPEAA